MKNLLIAAESGDTVAQFNVGVVYYNGIDDNGRGIKCRRAEAIEWFLKAAHQGLPRAQARLAEVYADGAGKPQDAIEAYAWFEVAMENLMGAHRLKVQSGLTKLSAGMTPAQIAKGHRLTSSYRPKISFSDPVTGRGAKALADKTLADKDKTAAIRSQRLDEGTLLD